MSLLWRLRNRVARARHLGHAAAPPTETSSLSKGGRMRAIKWARARGQRWIGLFLAFLSILLTFLEGPDDSETDKDDTLHEDSQRVPMQNGPLEQKNRKAQKNQKSVNQIQKNILKPGAGKNPHAHRKNSTPKPGPVSLNKGPKGKGIVGESNSNPSHTALETKKEFPKPNEEERESRRKQEALMLEELRRIKQNPVAALEASRIGSNVLNSFVVKNAFLNQLPPGEGEGTSMDILPIMANQNIPENKPPD
ncbi:hypothetical protein PIB30_020326 [Stylosanthes scabra]|uniref:Uncharacterized protein n=1 Tax=Stylosanthes scabra TaxID=79078 RepID=A0ABU6X8G4_9FABA|nr:hypothetical protein [Stylosanthes scabra]